MSCVSYNLLKDGSLINVVTTVSGVQLLDSGAIAALYDNDFVTPAYTLSGTPQSVHIQQEFGESFDVCFVRYYTNQATTSGIDISYTGVEGITTPLIVVAEAPGVLRADIDADVNFLNLTHTVSGTSAVEVYQLEIYGVENETLGFGSATEQMDYYHAEHSTAHTISAAVNKIKLFNDSQYDDVARVAIAPTLTAADDYLFLSASGSGPFYGINDYGFSQPGPNPINLHDDNLLNTYIDSQWILRTPAQKHAAIPTQEGLILELDYNPNFGGTATRKTSGICSKEAFTAQSFTAEVQVRYLSIDNSGFDNSVRNFLFVLTNSFPVGDIGYHNSWMTDRRRGSSVAGIKVSPTIGTTPTASTLRYRLRWVDGSVSTNPQFDGTLESASTDYRFAPDLFLIEADQEADEINGPTISELEDIRFGGDSFGDFTSTARWHTWKIVYDNKKKQISAYIDNIHIGDRVMKIEAFGEGCRLFVGVNGHGGLKMAIRNFKIYPNKVYKQYKVSSPKFGTVATATISGSEAHKINDDSTTVRYIGPEPTANARVRLTFAEPSDVVRYRIKQRDQASSVSAYGKTYFADVAIQALVDFGGVHYQPHEYEVTSSFVQRTPTLSGSHPTVASGINYLDFQFIEYDRTTQTNGALIIDEIEVYAEEFVEHASPGGPDERNIAWVEGRWNNLRQYGTSTGLAIKYKNGLTPGFFPYPEYVLQNVDYGFSSAVNGRQLGDSTNEYHHGGSLFTSPGTSAAGDYRQWHSGNQSDNHIFIWRYFPEISRIRSVYWDSSTFNRAYVADKFKFQYLSENGDPNVEADWVDIPPVTKVHPFTGGTHSADTNYKNYKNYLIANNDGIYYTNYYLIPTYGTGFTVATTGSLVSFPQGLTVPAGYVSASIAVGMSATFPHTNGLRGFVEFDQEYSTRAIRMVVFKSIESGSTGTAGTVRTSFALDQLIFFRLNGSGSYTSPTFDTGTPQNTERLSASIREFEGTASDIFVRSNDNPPEFLYDDTYEVWWNTGSAGLLGVSFGNLNTTDRVIPYGGLLYFIRQSSVRAYNTITDTWGAAISYPQSGSSAGSTFDSPTDGTEDDVATSSSPAIPDDSVLNNCALMGDVLYVACRTTGNVRTPRIMYYDFSATDPAWTMIRENRAPFSEDAFMVGYEPTNSLYFFNEDGTVSYFDLAEGNWIIVDAIMPTIGTTREGMSSLLFEDKVYIFGGVLSGPNGDGTRFCHVFDMKTQQFSSIASAPHRMKRTQAVLVPEHRVVYIISQGNGQITYEPTMKYDIDSNSWTTVESMMWFRDSTNLQVPAPAYVYYYDGFIYQNTASEGISKAKVLRTPWTAGKFPDLRDPVWGGQLGAAFPWVKLDTLGELMAQERYVQFKIELYSNNRSASPILEDVTVVTPHDIPVPASGTSYAYLKVGVSPESLYEAWYSADRVGNFTGTGGASLPLSGDYSMLYTKAASMNEWGIATTASGAWDPINDASSSQMVAVSSPWVIKDSPTSYRLWFTNDYNGASTGTLGCNIHYAEAVKPSSLFNDRRVIVEGVISQAATGVKQPCVIQLSPSSYKIWYTGLDSSGVRRILSAASVNGTTWTGHAVSLNIGRSVWDTTAAYRPCVLLEGSTYRMWYTGNDAAGVMRILYTESTDGSTWIDPRIVIDVASEGELDYVGSFNPYVLKDATQYVCYYIGYDGVNRSVISATSPDGLEWFDFQLSVPPGGLMEFIDGDGVVDFFVILNKDTIVPGSMISGAQLKLHNDGAAL